MKMTAGSICRRNFGILSCNNASGDNKLQYCENHYREHTDLQSKEKNYGPPPPDEQRCCISNGVFWRCKNLRMNPGSDCKYCEKHYKQITDEERCGFRKGVTWRCKNFRCENSKYCEKHNKVYTDLVNKVNEKDNLPPDEERCCESNNGVLWRCKNFRMNLGGDAADDDDLTSKYCEKHYILNKIKHGKKKRRKEEMKNMPLDELGCCTNDGIQWRCKKFRKRRRRRRYDKSTGCSTPSGTQSTDSKRRKNDSTDTIVDARRRKKVTEDDRSNYVTGIQQEATNDTSDRILDGGSTDIGTKRKNVGRTDCSGELESLTGIREPMVKLESLEHYKSRCFELSLLLEKKKAECNKLQLELEERAPEDGTECWRKMFSDLESRVNSTLGCVESRITRLECQILSMETKNSTMAACMLNEITQSGEKQSGENNRSKPNAETSSPRGRKDSHVYDVGVDKHYESQSESPRYSAVNISSGSRHLSTGGENVEERKGRVCSEETPSQNGLSSQHHLEMSEKRFVNLVSDDDSDSFVNLVSDDHSSDTSTDSGGSLGDFMEMLAMKYKNENKQKEMEWKCEADMLSSFDEDPELCMKAVYRQHISGYETSAKGFFHYRDSLRINTLAQFLMDGASQADLKKSVKELDVFDSEAVEDCKRLARSYSKQLFSIYQDGKDPFFLPATSAK